MLSGERLPLSRRLRPCSGRQQAIAENSRHILVLWWRLHIWGKGLFWGRPPFLQWQWFDSRIWWRSHLCRE